MLGKGREGIFMVKIAGSLGGVLLICGLSFAQSDSHPAAGAASKPASAGAPVTIQQFSGVLMDATCASGGGGTAEQANSGAGAKGDAANVDSGRPEKGHKKHSAQPQSCPVSASTSSFALKTESGQVMKFDMVGNSRAAEQLKVKTAWTKNLSEGKPIHAKVSGILNGETITVTSI